MKRSFLEMVGYVVGGLEQFAIEDTRCPQAVPPRRQWSKRGPPGAPILSREEA